MPTLRVIGAGRAGRSLAKALSSVGWDVVELIGRGAPVHDAAGGVDVLVIATPDDVVAEVAAAVQPVDDTLVVHLSGSLTLGVLDAHARAASLHPLASLPDPEAGARTLLSGCPMALAGDPGVSELAGALGARAFHVPDEHRALYHATAVVAANHLTAVMAQVERLADACEVPSDVFLQLAAQSLDNIRAVGARAALTGPAARGDTATLQRHLEALPEAEHELYLELARQCAAIAGQSQKVSPC